jgi:hypothetical protein
LTATERVNECLSHKHAGDRNTAVADAVDDYLDADDTELTEPGTG